MRKPKIGDRVKWVSLDETVVEYGTVESVSPSCDKVQVRWDDDEIATHKWGGESRVFHA